jgi:uncharacterized protein
MPDDPAFYLFALPAVLLIGLAKGGFTGLGALGMPLMALGMDDPVRAAAILLPILIAQDVVGVAAFRRSWDGAVLAAMLPGAAVGIGLGWLLAARISSDAVMAALGAISILFGAYRLAVERGGRIAASSNSPAWVGSLFGIAAGFTSQIAHAGGPPFQIYVMPQRLPRDIFVGTGAVLFALINWIKVPPYLALGQMTLANMATAGALFPVAIASTWAGVLLVRRVSGQKFYTAVYVLLVLVGAKLIYDGATALF